MLFLFRMMFWLFVVAMLMPERGQTTAKAAAQAAEEARQAAVGYCTSRMGECLGVAGRAMKAGEELAAGAAAVALQGVEKAAASERAAAIVPVPVARPRSGLGG